MIKTHTLKDIGWFERTDQDLIYIYLTNGDRVRVSQHELRYMAKQVK